MGQYLLHGLELPIQVGMSVTFLAIEAPMPEGVGLILSGFLPIPLTGLQMHALPVTNKQSRLTTGYLDFRYFQYSFHGDIFAAISNDGGLSWPGEYQATNNHTAWYPQIDFVADTLIMVWSDMRFYDEGAHEIFFNRSNNSGQTWQGEERITNTIGESYDPSVSLDNGKIHVAWREELESGASEIYYKKFTPDSTDSVDEPDLSPPTDFSLSAYPNPFNSSITISIISNEPGILNIYDIGGRIIRQYPFEKGSQRIIWDGKGTDNQPLSSGTYFIGRKGEMLEKCLKVEFIK